MIQAYAKTREQDFEISFYTKFRVLAALKATILDAIRGRQALAQNVLKIYMALRVIVQAKESVRWKQQPSSGIDHTKQVVAYCDGFFQLGSALKIARFSRISKVAVV